MAWQIKVLATKPEKLSLILGIHVVEGELQLPRAVCPLTSVCAHAHSLDEN